MSWPALHSESILVRPAIVLVRIRISPLLDRQHGAILHHEVRSQQCHPVDSGTSAHNSLRVALSSCSVMKNFVQASGQKGVLTLCGLLTTVELAPDILRGAIYFVST